MKIFLIVLCILFLLLFVFYIVMLIVFLNVFKRRKPVTEEGIKYYMDTHDLGEYEEEIENGINRFKTMEKEEVYIKSYDGYKLKGYYVKNEQNKNITIILAHGYHSAPYFDFSIGFQEYLKLGFDLLFVEERAHEYSQGKFTTFGIKERFDVRDWAKYVNNRYPENDIILAGVSMGSSSVLYSLNLDLPEKVVGAICDCGFSDSYEELTWYFCKNPKWYHKFIIWTLEIQMKLYEGISFKDTNAFIALKDNKIPILIAHSETDEVVPFYMGKEIYEAITTEKAFVDVKNARHAQSFLRDREHYKETLYNFLSKVVK